MSHPSPQPLHGESGDRNPAAHPIHSVEAHGSPCPALHSSAPSPALRQVASSQLLQTHQCPRPMHLTWPCAQLGPQCFAPTHVLGFMSAGSPHGLPSSLPVPSELLKSNSSRWLLTPGDGPGSQALLLDEDRAWLMVGAKNHIVLLHLEQPGREPEKVSVGQWV